MWVVQVAGILSQPLITLQAKAQIRWFQKIQAQTRYEDGMPLHALGPAQFIIPLQVSSPSTSDVFVVQYGDFTTLSGQDIQAVFRHRHIMVLNVPAASWAFNLEDLYRIGDLDTEVEMQGQLTVACSSIRLKNCL